MHMGQRATPMKNFVKCSICGISEPADEVADGVCNVCRNGHDASNIGNLNGNVDEPVAMTNALLELEWINRDEYREKIEELVSSGKLPKSYKSTVINALYVISPHNIGPKNEVALSLYERYRNAIPDVPDTLRFEVDKRILDTLVSEKKLSAVSRDGLLRELKKIKFYHDRVSTHSEREKERLERETALEESVRAADRANQVWERTKQELERNGEFRESSSGSLIGNWAAQQLLKAQAEAEQRSQNSRCPNCKNNVSTSAYTCPSCGHPIRFGGARAGAGCLGWIIIFVAIPVFLLVFLLSLG